MKITSLGAVFVYAATCTSAAQQRPGFPASPNDFLSRGAPTFVLGTAGDDRADRAIAAQVNLIRNLLFPGTQAVTDESIDVAAGPDAWPPRPILYGGPHVNSVLRALAPTLPFEMDEGALRLGDRVFEGDELNG